MPRLLSRLAKPKDRYLRATRDVHGGLSSTGIAVLVGQFVRADHPSVKSYPDAFEEVPPLEERAGPPGANDAAAVAQAAIIRPDGRLVFPGQRLWPDDELVRRFPRAFAFSAPPR